MQVHGGQALDDVTQCGHRSRAPTDGSRGRCLPQHFRSTRLLRTPTHAIARLHLGNSGIKPQIGDFPDGGISRHGSVAPLQQGRIGTPMDGRSGKAGDECLATRAILVSPRCEQVVVAIASTKPCPNRSRSRHGGSEPRPAVRPASISDIPGPPRSGIARETQCATVATIDGSGIALELSVGRKQGEVCHGQVDERGAAWHRPGDHRIGCPGGDDRDLLRRGRARAANLPAGCQRLGRGDRQPGQRHLDAQFGDRAAGALSADPRRQLVGHRRLPDRRDLAGHPGQSPARPQRLHRPGDARSALPGDRREQHGRRPSGRDALVHRRRHPLLPPGSAREARQAAADHLAGAEPDRGRDPGRGARRRQRPDVGLRVPGEGLRGPDLQRARVDRQLRRRHHRRR